MKNMRKIATLLLALALILSLAAPVFAADGPYTITIKNEDEGHIYEAYQIFTGDLSDGILSNIQWGDSITNAEELPEAADVAEKLDSAYEGEDKLNLDDLLGMIELSETAYADSGETSNPYVISELEAGYYLVKDKDGSLTGKEDEAYTEYMIKVVENVETTPKASVPSVEKKVQDTNDSTGETTGWQDSADYDIGDDVPFQLTATLADNVSAYETYKIVFHDTLSEGLTYNKDAKVTFNGTDVTSYFTITEENGELTISCDDVKEFDASDGAVITVEYTAELNEDAVIGAAGNPNVVYLEYSNNPNWESDGNPDTPDEPDTGKTPEDKVIVFTYQAIVNKVDEKNEALKGAGFTLYKEVDGKWVQIGEELVGGDLTKFTWIGLDDGNYKLAETTTPAGYNTVEDIYFTIDATHDVDHADPKLTGLVVKDADGNVISEGETASFTATAEAGTVETTVVNQSGATLPETGGIGTTIFYAVGAIMVLGAVVLLVTKKRMAA